MTGINSIDHTKWLGVCLLIKWIKKKSTVSGLVNILLLYINDALPITFKYSSCLHLYFNKLICDTRKKIFFIKFSTISLYRNNYVSRAQQLYYTCLHGGVENSLPSQILSGMWLVEIMYSVHNTTIYSNFRQLRYYIFYNL